MKKWLILMAVLTMSALSSSCTSREAAKIDSTATPAPSDKLVLSGSTTLLPIAQKAVEAFQKRKPEVKITLNNIGSLTGINALIAGYADIALSSRQLKKEEKEKLHAKKRDAKETIVAWDGIIPIVHPSNPVSNLTLAQLKDIYTGKITNWQEVGGKPGKIVLVARDFTSGTHEAWADLVLHNEDVAASAQEKSNSEAVMEMIASNPNAIGYDGIGYVEGNAQVKAVSVDGQMASANSILDKSYKIARPLFMFTSYQPTAPTVEFLNFVTSPEGQALVKEARFVPIHRAARESDGARPNGTCPLEHDLTEWPFSSLIAKIFSHQLHYCATMGIISGSSTSSARLLRRCRRLRSACDWGS